MYMHNIRSCFELSHDNTPDNSDRVDSLVYQLHRAFSSSHGSVVTMWLPQAVEFTHNASRSLGIGHPPFEVSFGFNHEEPPTLEFLFSIMRPSTNVSMATTQDSL
jgi:hypothetical protein